MTTESQETRCLRMEAAVLALQAAVHERARRKRRPPRIDGDAGDTVDPFELAELRALSCACPRCIACREA